MTESPNKKQKKKPKSKVEKNKLSKQSAKDLELISKLKKQLEDAQDKHLRLQAEFDNFRRRKMKELSSLLQFEGESVIKGFLPILDDIERMIESSSASENSLKDGIKMMDSKIKKFLESLDVKSFGNIGDEMDPEIHNAMMTQTDETVEDHIILNVFEKGFTYHEKVIRHANVIVNKR
ncbi:MAG: nucleotide exchange factor GrpE [Candidatus Marinimicrobia bacterium]|nr:nucleotide exchange factor GrpE [Candidatus Neomarinimicrobiota bacterium]MBT3501086.1 nucleotide exchange factor GrpE [Candidatus Neomarinimicrobiota bacterium]MBT3838951.1 nucleotide exchange factor GrpE [Candidatus Neomarinimicrobiota bacterium]MBT4000215.1 nucleotide exchange factor GrpE [Candidatus Neomarinimicrobiota bacterium]MBT4282024.1 nucleotide exchange factor GrpE [Candidatus Neomarinimicrobiota bacterium]